MILYIKDEQLSNVIYGGIDGIITTFAIICGAFGSGQSISIAFILACANLVADGFSMGISSYQSILKDTYNNQALYTGITTFVSFILFGFIPLIWFIFLIYKKKQILNFNYLDLNIIILLTVFSFILLGLIKGIYQKKYLKKKIWKTVSETVLIGSFAGFISFLVAYKLSKELK